MRYKVDLVKQVVNEIENWITEGKVSDGELLPSEGELSIQLEVSRATVRDAVRILEVRGYVERLHGIGIRVNNRSAEVAMNSLSDMIVRNGVSYEELLQVRYQLEPKAVALATEHATEADLKAMEACILSMEKETSNSPEFKKCDFTFHILIAKASGNRLISTIIEAYSNLLINQIKQSNEGMVSLKDTIACHRDIYEAIKAKDANRAWDLMIFHLKGSEENLLHSQE